MDLYGPQSQITMSAEEPSSSFLVDPQFQDLALFQDQQIKSMHTYTLMARLVYSLMKGKQVLG